MSCGPGSGMQNRRFIDRAGRRHWVCDGSFVKLFKMKRVERPVFVEGLESRTLMSVGAADGGSPAALWNHSTVTAPAVQTAVTGKAAAPAASVAAVAASPRATPFKKARA